LRRGRWEGRLGRRIWEQKEVFIVELFVYFKSVEGFIC